MKWARETVDPYPEISEASAAARLSPWTRSRVNYPPALWARYQQRCGRCADSEILPPGDWQAGTDSRSSYPRVTDLHVHEGEPLRFKASFEIMPEIKVEGYKDLRAERAGGHGHRRAIVKTPRTASASNTRRLQSCRGTHPWQKETSPRPR